MLDTTIHQMKTNTTKNHNSIYAGHHHTPDEDKQSKTTTQYMLDTAIHQMKTNKAKPQLNICWIPPCTRHKTKTNMKWLNCSEAIIPNEI
jgi:hypothetical protein